MTSPAQQMREAAAELAETAEFWIENGPLWNLPARIRALPLPPDPITEEMAKALEELLPGDETLERIIWKDLPDSASGSSTFKLGTIRRARKALASYRNGEATKENPPC